MTVSPQRRTAQYDDLLALPEHLVGEILGGELLTHPRPSPRHARASSALGIKIGGPFDQGEGGGPGGWWVLDEPELHLGPDILVPDLAGWRRERLPQLPETAWLALPPDWVCEVLSPATARVDRMRKLPCYAAHGVDYCWLVDPTARTLEAFRRAGEHWLLQASFVEDAEVRVEPFAAVAFPLAALWAD